MKMKKLLFYAWIGLLFIACEAPLEEEKESNTKSEKTAEVVKSNRPLAKFEPADGKVILFVGQELNAIGGLDEYSEGYLDYFKTPAGWTAYTNLSPGDTSFGYVQKGLDGMESTDDWGDNVSNMSLQAADPDFKNMALAIGLSMVGHDKQVAEGEHDDLIERLANFLKDMAPRPVFLRIGYEFDGHAWNFYNREHYLTAYRRVKDKFDEMQVENVAFVWQSTGWVSDQQMLEAWYPGDDYVDWCAFSFFSRWKEQEMVEFARKKGKPVFIAEATPTISDYMVKFDGNTKHTVLSKPEQAQEAWDRWFVPLFKTIDDNPDVVKAVSYINCHWLSHEMWKQNPTFKRVDARLQTSEMISEKWKKEVYQDKYLHASPTLFSDLAQNK